MKCGVSPRNGGKDLPSSLVKALGLGAGAALRTVGSALAWHHCAPAAFLCVLHVSVRVAPPLPP